MRDLYLKFSTEQEFLTILDQSNLLIEMPVLDDESGIPTGEITKIPIQFSHQHAFDQIGEIPNVDGYHVNLRLIDLNLDVSLLEPYQVFPNTPTRIWT